MQNYSVDDAQALILAFAVFSALLIPPGYAFGLTLNCLRFRERTPLIRLLLSLVLSIACTPILVFLLARVSGSMVLPLYAITSLAFAVHLLTGRRLIPFVRSFYAGSGRLGVLISFGIAAVVGVSLIDLQLGHRLYYSMSAYDYNFRAAVIDAISRRGIPPVSPFFHPGHDNPFRYHYFWFMLCSVAQRLTGGLASARQAQIAGSCWIGVVLCAIVSLYVRFFCIERWTDIRKRALVALSLLCVSGLDIIPVALKSVSNILHHTQVGVFGSAEWWSADPVTSWIHAVLWVPHHVAGVIACLTGFLLLWDLAPEDNLGHRAKSWGGAGLCFASAVGLSVHVTFAFAAALVIWTVVALSQGWRRQAKDLLAAGVVAFAVAIPFMMDLLSSGGGRGATTTPLVFGVRQFRPLEALLTARGFGPHAVALGDLLALPLNYFAELGFFLVIAFLFLRDQRNNEVTRQYRLAICTLTGVVLAICTFLRSGVIGNNDLGWRGILIAQFFLLLAAIDYVVGLRVPPMWQHYPRFLRPLLATLLLLGLLPSVFEVVTQRFHSVLVDASRIAPDLWAGEYVGMGARTLALRSVYGSLGKSLPVAAILQHNPDTFQDIPSGLYANRQRVLMGNVDYTAFGGNAQEQHKTLDSLLLVFRRESTLADLRSACRDFQIDAMVINAADPVWKNPASWVWTAPSIAQAPQARAISCKASSP